MNLSILLPDGNISTIQLPEEEGQDSNQLAIDLIVDVSAAIYSVLLRRNVINTDRCCRCHQVASAAPMLSCLLPSPTNDVIVIELLCPSTQLQWGNCVSPDYSFTV